MLQFHSLPLLIIFIIHFAIFLRLAIIHKKDYYVFFSITFFLLILSFSVRLWWYEMEIGGFKSYQHLQMTAWLTTAVALIMTIRSKYRKWKNNRNIL